MNESEHQDLLIKPKESFLSKFSSSINTFWKIFLVHLSISLLIIGIGLFLYKKFDISNYIPKEYYQYEMDAFFSMVTLVFIVTSLISILSDKSEMVYWESVIKHNLVNPLIGNILGLSACLCSCVLVSTISFIQEPTYVFICLITTILILFILTFKLIGAYFYREEIQRNMAVDFAVEKYASDLYNSLERLEKYISSNTFNKNSDSLFNEIATYSFSKSADINEDIFSKQRFHNNKILSFISSKFFPKLSDLYKTDFPKLAADYKKLKDFYPENDSRNLYKFKSQEEFLSENPDSKVDFNEYEDALNTYESEKSDFLKKMETIKFPLKPFTKDFSKKGHLLISSSMRQISDSNIEALYDNLVLLHACGFVGNMNQLLSALAHANPEIYFQTITILD